MKEFASCVLQTKIKSLFQHICHCECQSPCWEGEIYGLIHQSQWRGKMQSHSEQIDEDDLFPPPPTQRVGSLQKKISETTLVAENAKRGKKKGPKFADVWKQIKSAVALQLSLIWWRTFLNVSGASSAQWPSGLERNCTKILPSIRSVLIRLAHPSSSSCIWISAWPGAGFAHVPGLLRVPSAACQYARDTMDQCLLNHFPNRGNDNYKKWRLCTLCKCCAMTLEPNGPSY